MGALWGACKGYSIGFNEAKLKDYIEKISNTLLDYSPCPNINDYSFDEFLNFADIAAQNITYKKILPHSYPFEFINDMQNYSHYKESAFTKHEGFSEEKEFRIALLFGKNKSDFFHTQFSEYVLNKQIDDSGEIKYIDLNFPSELIDEIYIGPLNTTETDELEEFLHKHQIYCKVKNLIFLIPPKEIIDSTSNEGLFTEIYW